MGPFVFDGLFNGWNSPYVGGVRLPERPNYPDPSDAGVGGPSVMKRSPEEQLAKLQGLIDDNNEFVWSKVPGTGPRGRGLYPTWKWTSAWYEGALRMGFEEEDIGFTLHDLYDAWHDFVDRFWPGDARNNAVISQTYEPTMPWQESHEFPTGSV